MKGLSLYTSKAGVSRWRVICRDGSAVYFSRAVVEAELGRHLRSDEYVHHINEALRETVRLRSNGLGEAEVAERLGLTRMGVRHRLRMAAERGLA